MEIIQSIALDFAQNATQATVFAKQYDKDTRKIEITPLNNGSPYTIDTDVTARLQMTKSDGTTVINNAEISSGKITVVLTAQALTSAGTAVAEIGLYKGSTLLSSQTFYIDVQKGAYDEDAPESSDEYNALVEALGEAEQATATAEAASERAEAAVDSANTAIETARTVATGKMSLIPIDPTVEEIEAMPSGQIYGDTVNHKGIVKDGQEFYDTAAIDALIPDISGKEDKIITDVVPPFCKSTYPIGTKFLYNNRLYEYIQAVNTIIITQMCVYRIIGRKLFTQNWQATPPSSENTANRVSTYRVGDLWSNGDTSTANISGYLGGDVYICTKVQYQMEYNTVTYNYNWKKLPFDATTLNGYGIADAYTKTEVDSLISAISTLSFEVAQTKPVSNIKTNVIYLIPKSTAETDNIYEEWIYVNNAWELIGSTEIDLSNYYTKNEINDKLTYKANIYDPVDIVPNVSSDYDFGAEYTSPEIPTGSSRKKPSEGDYVYNTDHFDLWICTGVSTNFGQNTYHFTLTLLARGGKDINNVYTKTETNTLLSTKETTSNKVTSLSAQSTDAQYPSAKCVYDLIGNVESLLAEV